MCRPADALAVRAAAAECLAATCAARIHTADMLRATYRAVTEEPLPPRLAATLDKLGDVR